MHGYLPIRACLDLSNHLFVVLHTCLPIDEPICLTLFCTPAPTHTRPSFLPYLPTVCRLEEFKKLNPAIDLVKGAEIEMTIRGDTLLYKNAVGGVGMLQSATFCKALCEIYYGDSPVSPTHKEAVIAGIPELFKK